MLAETELDGVIIAIPHAAHYDVAARCLDAGLNVMLEKPMVLTAKHAADLIRRAEAQAVELIIGYPWHFTRTARPWPARSLGFGRARRHPACRLHLFRRWWSSFYRGKRCGLSAGI